MSVLWIALTTASWAHPATQDELVAAVPKDAFGVTGPLINELSGVTVGIEITLTKDALVDGVPCSAQTFGVADKTWGCHLSMDHTFGKYTVKAGEYAGIHLGSGTLRSLRMPSLTPATEQVELGGVHCSDFLWLHPGGRLAGCKLVEDFAVGKRVFKANTELQLYASGAAKSAMIYESHTWDGKTYPSGEVEFGETGEITNVNPGYHGD